MSDFDSAVEKATRLFGGMSQHDHDIAAIFYSSAITSMQGEAPKGFALVPIVTTRAMDDVMREPDWQWIDVLAAAESISEDDYFEPYPPSAASKIAEQDARIKELEQKLEVARKDAERYRFVRMPPVGRMNVISWDSRIGKYNDCVGHALDQAIDAAIRQIGGAE